MLRAVSTIVCDRPMLAHEIACAAMGAPECRFEARDAAE
jgi:predicted hydrocarbon binding protein